jgi:hypothetical protein
MNPLDLHPWTLDPTEAMKGEHLQGKKAVVQIAEITVEETHPRQGITEQTPVAHFTGRKKGLILSPTNQRALKALFGDDVSACKGKWVTLEAVSMRVAGRDTLPIRIGPAQQPNGQAKETQVIAPAKPEADKPQAPGGFTGDAVEEASHES